MGKTDEDHIIERSDYQSIESLFDEILRVLKTVGVETCINASDREIFDFEESNSVKLSHEVKLYYKKMNGLDGGQFLTRLVPISELRKVQDYDWFIDTTFTREELSKMDNIFVLGDVLINSHQWGIRFNNQGKKEEIIELDHFQVVSGSICDFLVKLINEGPYSLISDR